MKGEGTIAEVLAGAARWSITEGDSALVLPSIPDASIHAIVADPPAGIAFMGKEWDTDKGGKAHWIAWLAGILAEAFRVLKPGGHMLLWALPRTSHWTAEAGERAGFEIRDVIVHLFGSGFPKSLNVSKAIDAAAGATREAIRPVASPAGNRDGTDALGGGWQDAPMVSAPATSEARTWDGWGTALKPASEHWILFRKPLEGTVAANVLAHGTGALNIDAARVGTGATLRPNGPIGYHGGGAGGIGGSESGRFPANLILSHTAWEETHCPCGAHLSFVARFCPECGSDAVAHRRAGCCAVGERSVKGDARDGGDGKRPGGFVGTGAANGDGKPAGTLYGDPDGLETVTAWECLATCSCGRSRLAASGGAAPRCACGRGMVWACPVARLDEQSGESASVVGSPRGAGSGAGWGMTATGAEYADSGGASRFFNTFAPPDDVELFFYCAKPSTAEAEAGCERLPLKRAHENVDREEGSAGMQSPRAGAGRTSGRRNHHPTKKSIALMRYFVRLVTPPGGIVLDMFAGSGTTIASAALEGFRAIGIEMGAEYVPIGRARVAFWSALAGTQAAAEGTPKPKRDAGDERQRTIFDLLSGDP